MRHALSQRCYDECIRMVSWFFRNRMNTSDHSRREFLVTLLGLGARVRLPSYDAASLPAVEKRDAAEIPTS